MDIRLYLCWLGAEEYQRKTKDDNWCCAIELPSLDASYVLARSVAKRISRPDEVRRSQTKFDGHVSKLRAFGGENSRGTVDKVLVMRECWIAAFYPLMNALSV